MSIATAGNDHRLGGDEAPPPIVSIFLGDELTAILKSLENDRPLTDTYDRTLEIGVDALNPLEVKAGMNPVALKQKYGDKLVFHGGINAVLWSKPDEIRAEIEHVVPVMKQGGGYIFASDHSIPDNISLENFKLVLETLRRVGSY